MYEAVKDEHGNSEYTHQAWFRRLVIGRLAIGISWSRLDKGKMNTPNVAIYNRLSTFRAERGMPRQALANALGISYQTVVSLERGEYTPSLDLALRISQLFEQPIEAIFTYMPLQSLYEEAHTW